MRRRQPNLIALCAWERAGLQRLLRDGGTEQRVARRVRVLLEMENEVTVVDELANKVDMTRAGIWSLCRRYEESGIEAVYDAPRSGRPWVISPLQRVQIEQLACCEPTGVGLFMTHWSTSSLAKVAKEMGVVPSIAHSTVSLILGDATL